MRRSRLVVLFASAAAFATACNALTGASDLTADLCAVNCGDDASLAVNDAASDRQTPETADTSVGDGGIKHPTFCLGLVFYAAYDPDTTSTVGPSPVPITTSKGAAQVVAGGKFGNGFQVVGESSIVYYPFVSGSTYPDRVGTIAAWFKPVVVADASADRILLKPIVDMSNAVYETAPEVRFTGSGTVFGLTNQDPQGLYESASINSSSGSMVAGWKPDDFNHFVGTWNHDSPSLGFWLNGGSTADTYAENKDPWTTQVPSPTGYLRLSSSVTPANGIFDELAVWNRELGPNEVTALYTSPVAIADACGL